MGKKVEVSICCTVYNHEKYLRKCLDGFVMQKTDFVFEVLIHDDRSTDMSADIIREYCEKYPDIFVPVLQSENQYSKGVLIIDDILIPMAKGKYIAICEGDDYWCDENKLQLQYNYMESNSDCSMCVHNSVFHYVNNEHEDKIFNEWKEFHIMNAEEVFNDYKVHTSSYFARKEYIKVPDFGRKCWGEDYVILTWLYTIGKIAVLPQAMSVYNYGVYASATYINSRDREKNMASLLSRIDYLEKLNAETEYKYSNAIEKQIGYYNFVILMSKHTEIVEFLKNIKDVVPVAKAIASHEYYPEFIKSTHGLNRLRIRFKFEGYVFYPIWKFAYLIYYGKQNHKRKSQ